MLSEKKENSTAVFTDYPAIYMRFMAAFRVVCVRLSNSSIPCLQYTTRDSVAQYHPREKQSNALNSLSFKYLPQKAIASRYKGLIHRALPFQNGLVLHEFFFEDIGVQ